MIEKENLKNWIHNNVCIDDYDDDDDYYNDDDDVKAKQENIMWTKWVPET